MKIKFPDIFGNIHEIDESKALNKTRVYGICIQGDQILLVKDESKMWDFPGGGVEEGETEKEALRREFLEETGLTIASDINLLKRFDEHFYAYDLKEAWKSDRQFYLVTKVKGDILKGGNDSDTLEAKFFPLDKTDSDQIKPKVR